MLKTIKTSELIGAALDFAVAKASGVELDGSAWDSVTGLVYTSANVSYEPSRDWAVAGPLIEKERIGIRPHDCPAYGVHLSAAQWSEKGEFGRFLTQGPTQLVAAMRCFVMSKLGDAVGLPESDWRHVYGVRVRNGKVIP